MNLFALGIYVNLNCETYLKSIKFETRLMFKDVLIEISKCYWWWKYRMKLRKNSIYHV